MKKVCLLSLAVLFAFSAFGAAAATAQDVNPERLAHHCVKKINKQADRSIAEIAHTTHRCLHRIRYLLAHGQVEEALRTAHRCAERIARIRKACVGSIAETCERCIHILREQGANELAERVALACRSTIERVNNAAERAIKAIRKAVSDGGSVDSGA